MGAVASTEQPKGVVLAFGEASGGVPPRAAVAGLPLALRAILELSRAGVTRIALLIEDEAAGRELAADERIAAEVEIVRAASLDALEAAIEEMSVVVPAAFVAHRDVYRDLADAARAGRLVHAPAENGAGAFTATRDVARALAAREHALAGHAPIAAPWAIRADDAAGRRRIVYELFEGCRKPVDGIVSRHLNRHVSIFVSKRIVDTRLSPNTITVMTLFLGVAASLVTARASYGAMVLGAGLLQLNSILDGVDGELARVRFQYSKLGQWLDTVCDDLANTMFYGGAAYAAFQLEGLPSWLPWFGVAAVIGSVLTMTMYYAELVRLGSGDFYALDVGQDEIRTGWWAALNRGARYVTKRDFFVFGFLIAAVLGILPYLLPIMAVGTLATVVTGLRITLARFRPAR